MSLGQLLSQMQYGQQGLPWDNNPDFGMDPNSELYQRLHPAPAQNSMLGTPGINGGAPIQQLPDLTQVNTLLDQQTQAKKKAITDKSKAKTRSPLPRPGAIGLAILADLLLGKGKGHVLNSFLGGYGQGAQFQNQQDQSDADTQSQLDLADAENAGNKADLATKDYQNQVMTDRQAKAQEAIDSRYMNNQQAMMDRQVASQKAQDDRNSTNQFNTYMAKIAADNYGSVPADLWDAANQQRQSLIDSGIPEGALRPLFSGQSTKGGEAQLRMEYRKQKMAEADKMIPIKIKNLQGTIDDRIKRTDAWLKHMNVTEGQAKERIGIARDQLKVSQGQLGVAQGNLQERKHEYNAKPGVNIYLPSKDEKDAQKHINELSEAKSAADTMAQQYEHMGWNSKNEDGTPKDPILSEAYDKVVAQSHAIQSKMDEASKHVPKFQGMTRAQWIQNAEFAKKQSPANASAITKRLNEALRKLG